MDPDSEKHEKNKERKFSDTVPNDSCFCKPIWVRRIAIASNKTIGELITRQLGIVFIGGCFLWIIFFLFG